MAPRRTARAHPDWMAYSRAMAARKSVLHVIVRTIKKNKKGGEKIIIRTGSSFVIKVDLQANESFLLTCEHVVRGRLKPGDGLSVRRMLPVGVEEFSATIIHKSRSMDVAILKVSGLTAATPLRFSPEDPIAGEGIVSVGYCDPEDLFDDLSFCKIPALTPGRVREIVMVSCVKDIELYLVLLSCVGMQGMSGGPILSKRGVVAMIQGGRVGCTKSIYPGTILGVLKRCVGLQPEDNLTMEEVIDLLA